MSLRDSFSWEAHRTPSLDHDGVSIAFETRTLVIRFARGGFVWNMPAAALVERRQGSERIPIVDVTRRAVWALMALSALLWLFALLIIGIKRGRRR